MPVHFSTVADLHNKDSQNPVFDAADDAVVANAVFPKLTQAGTSEGLPDTAGVVEHSDTVTQKSKDATRYLRVELPQLTHGRGV